jgi:hypothetical protein
MYVAYTYLYGIVGYALFIRLDVGANAARIATRSIAMIRQR